MKCVIVWYMPYTRNEFELERVFFEDKKQVEKYAKEQVVPSDSQYKIVCFE